MTTFRMFNAVMAVLFAFGAAVQYNDPDPLRWIAIYLAAALVALGAAAGTRMPPGIPAGIAVIAVVWAVAIGVPGVDEAAHMFDAWEMRSLPVEEAREASGLFVIAAWSAFVAFRSRAGSR